MGKIKQLVTASEDMVIKHQEDMERMVRSYCTQLARQVVITHGVLDVESIDILSDLMYVKTLNILLEQRLKDEENG